MAKVLVVGGAGYVGGALTDRLLETAHDVRVYEGAIRLMAPPMTKPVAAAMPRPLLR